MYICIYVYMCKCIYVYINVCIYIYVYMYKCIYVYMCICIYAFMYICIYVYMPYQRLAETYHLVTSSGFDSPSSKKAILALLPASHAPPHAVLFFIILVILVRSCRKTQMRDACGRERSNVLLVEGHRCAEAWDELLLHQTRSSPLRN